MTSVPSLQGSWRNGVSKHQAYYWYSPGDALGKQWTCTWRVLAYRKCWMGVHGLQVCHEVEGAISQDLFVNHSVEIHSLLCWRPKGFSATLRLKWHWKHPQDLWSESELYLWFQRVVIHQCCWANSFLLPEKAEMRLWGPEFHMRRSLLPQQGQIVLSFYSHHNTWRKKVRPSSYSSRNIFNINLFGSCPWICWLLPTSPDSSLIIFHIVMLIFIISHNVSISWRFHAMFFFSYWGIAAL